MGEGTRLEREVELNATPEQVWETISSGPGMSVWFRTRCGTASFGKGWDLYLHNLVEYFNHFSGLPVVNIVTAVPTDLSGDEVWARFDRALGVDDEVAVGDPGSARTRGSGAGARRRRCARAACSRCSHRERFPPVPGTRGGWARDGAHRALLLRRRRRPRGGDPSVAVLARTAVLAMTSTGGRR